MHGVRLQKLVIYQSENGEIKVDVQVQDDTVWLSLNQIATVFERDKSVISRHLANIFKEGELQKTATVALFATVQSEGNRNVERTTEYYNLDVILSVGYRVNSKRGIEFRKWASKILKDYLIQGYSINQDNITQNKLNELQQTIVILTNTLINQNLVTETGKDLLNLIKSYAKTWDLLIRYDEDNLDIPINLQISDDQLMSITEARNAISTLKTELVQEMNGLFGLEQGSSLEGILGSIHQTFTGIPLYQSFQEKAAHLLYFIIKDHPFCDGNKRIGTLLFLLYLSKANVSLKNVDTASMTSLALLISTSDPSQKELMIKLIINLIYA